MSARILVATCLIPLALSGCVGAKSYVDPKYGNVGYEDVRPVAKKYTARVEIDFQRNGEDLPAADADLRASVDRVLRASGVVTPSTGESPLYLKVVCNNIADIGAATAKGVGTGLTLGAAGSTVVDLYEVTIELRRGQKVITKTYDHAIHTTVGNEDPPVPGVTPTSAQAAFADVVEDVILTFIKDMQSQGELI